MSSLITVTTAQELNDAIDTLDLHRQPTIGLVPTMGALHAGHGELFSNSVRDNDVTIASIFVNPLQFGAHEDLETYPRTLDADKKLLESLGVDIVFVPSVSYMYPELAASNTSHEGSERNFTTVRAQKIADSFEGTLRPGHFDGMLTVVLKLITVCRPENLILPQSNYRAYFGQKDAQQLQLIKTMSQDFFLPVTIKSVPIVREPLPSSTHQDRDDIPGLALSSRNQYLTAEQKNSALKISQALALLKNNFKNAVSENDRLDIGSVKSLISDDPELDIDYFTLVDPMTFDDLTASNRNLTPHVIEEINEYNNQQGVLAIAAVRAGKTRLLDNMWIIKPQTK